MLKALIPELVLADPEAGAAQLGQVFGFARSAEGVVLGSQRVILSKGDPDGRHGRIDHLALAVPSVPEALAACLGRGGQLSAETPGGPVNIPEFWEGGVDYVFLDGPEGAKIELIARRPPATPTLWGHDHIGLSCSDLAPMRAFFLDIGLQEQAAVTLHRSEGTIDVAFLAWGKDVLELYSLPGTRDHPSRTEGLGFWRRLRIQGYPERRVGPEGLDILPV